MLNIRDFDDDLHDQARIAAAKRPRGEERSIKAVVTEALGVLLAIPEDVRLAAQAKAEASGESLSDLVARAVQREVAQ